MLGCCVHVQGSPRHSGHCSLTVDCMLLDSLTAVLSNFDCCMTSKYSHNAAILQQFSAVKEAVKPQSKVISG